MSQLIKGSAGLVAAAKADLEQLSPEAIAAALGSGEIVLVDVREPEERRREGAIAGAVHVPRGLLEFAADPSSPMHHPALVPDRRIVLHCASGGRSALAAQTLKSMGYASVAHLEGGFAAWKAQDRSIVAV